MPNPFYWQINESGRTDVKVARGGTAMDLNQLKQKKSLSVTICSFQGLLNFTDLKSWQCRLQTNRRHCHRQFRRRSINEGTSSRESWVATAGTAAA